MKILVISLLRIGDLLMTDRLIKEIRSKYKNSQIHILTNQSNQVAEEIFAKCHFHYLDRSDLQNGLGEFDSPLFHSYFKLKNELENLNQENFDLLINVTQNKFSAWISSYIDCNDKIGWNFSNSGVSQFGSNWFRFLSIDEKISNELVAKFHLSDVYKLSFECEFENSMNQLHIENKIEPEKKIIGIQPFTSEGKKDWGINNWIELIKLYSKNHFDIQWVIYGAPFEFEKVSKIVEPLKELNINISSFISNFIDTFNHLKKVSLLISGDTSIKHLASMAHTKILELSIGSSDFMLTGAYGEGHVILQPQTSCAPCEHGGSCPLEVQKCAEELNPDFVANVLNSLMFHSSEDLELIEEENNFQVKVFKTRMFFNHFWMAVPNHKKYLDETIKIYLEKATWFLANLPEIDRVQFLKNNKITAYFNNYYKNYDKNNVDSILNKIKKEVNSKIIIIEKRLDSITQDKNYTLKSLWSLRRMQDLLKIVLSSHKSNLKIIQKLDKVQLEII